MARLMAQAAFRTEQFTQRYAPHMAAINRYVDALRTQGWLPYVAPLHGGTNARVLTFLRDPAPMTQDNVGSGYLCLENDPTAEHLQELLATVGLGSSDIPPWNAYPWYINRSPKSLRAERRRGTDTSSDRNAAQPSGGAPPRRQREGLMAPYTKGGPEHHARSGLDGGLHLPSRTAGALGEGSRCAGNARRTPTRRVQTSSRRVEPRRNGAGKLNNQFDAIEAKRSSTRSTSTPTRETPIMLRGSMPGYARIGRFSELSTHAPH